MCNPYNKYKNLKYKVRKCLSLTLISFCKLKEILE